MNNCLHLVPRLRRFLRAVMFNVNVCSLKGSIFLEAGEEQ